MRLITKIVIHWTASGDVPGATIDDWHRVRGFKRFDHPNSPLHYIGYAKVIRKNGTVEQGRPAEIQGVHVKGHNVGTVGIVLTGSPNDKWYPTDEQYSSLAREIKKLREEYSTIKEVVRHKDLNHTMCPGPLSLPRLSEFMRGELQLKEVELKMTDKEREKLNLLDKLVREILVGRSEDHEKELAELKASIVSPVTVQDLVTVQIEDILKKIIEKLSA